MILTMDGYEIRVTQRRNCRKMILHHRSAEHYFTLSVPYRTSRRAIEQFLLQNRIWMAQQMAQTVQAWQSAYAAGERHWVLGQQVTLGMNGVPTGAAFIKWRTQQLVQLLNELFPKWTKRMNVWTAKITLREMKSRWGSCNVRSHRISINTKLAKYPPICAEMIVVHELCHLHHADHSAAFYAEMDGLFAGRMEAERLLKKMDVGARPPIKSESGGFAIAP